MVEPAWKLVRLRPVAGSQGCTNPSNLQGKSGSVMLAASDAPLLGNGELKENSPEL